jgi:hypothetical protein
MNIDFNTSRVLAHSVMLFAKDDWAKDYSYIPWGSPRMCGDEYKAPDLAAANRAAVEANAETFPKLRALEAAAKLGRKIEVDGKIYDFRETGDIQVATAFARAAAQIAPELADKQLELAKQFGTQFSEQRRKELEALDPEKFKLYDQFLSDVKRDAAAPDTRIDSPTYEKVGIPTAQQDTGASQVIRSELERQIQQGLSQVGTLDPSMERRVQQAARARGSSINNLLGNPSAIRESLALQDALGNANSQRWNAAMGLLQSGQSTSDTANRNAQEAFQNILAATGQRNTAAQQSFAGQLTSQQQMMAGRQQNISNVQSALGLQPIVGQAANLGGLQQGSTPFISPQYTSGMQLGSPADLLKTGSSFALTNAQNQYESDQANSFMNQFKGYAGAIGNIGSSYAGFGLGGCFVARECIPDQWEAFYFWKELVGPKWFKSLYDSNAEKFAKWLKDKPKAKKLVANWMIARINSIIPKN